MRAERRKSVADFDLEGGGGLGPMSLGMEITSRRNGGWLIAVLALAALLGVGVIVLVAFSGTPHPPTLARTVDPPGSGMVTTTAAPTLTAQPAETTPAPKPPAPVAPVAPVQRQQPVATRRPVVPPPGVVSPVVSATASPAVVPPPPPPPPKRDPSEQL